MISLQRRFDPFDETKSIHATGRTVYKLAETNQTGITAEHRNPGSLRGLPSLLYIISIYPYQSP